MLKFIEKHQFTKFDPDLLYSYKIYPRNLEYSYHKTQFYLYFYLDPFKCYLDENKIGYIDISLGTIYFAYEPFYIGKGSNRSGYRMNQHVNDFLKDKGNNYLKRKKLEEIQKKLKENNQTLLDYKNNYIIIYRTFDNEKELLNAEMEIINKIGTVWLKNGPLTNKITKYQQEKFKRRQNEFF